MRQPSWHAILISADRVCVQHTEGSTHRTTKPRNAHSKKLATVKHCTAHIVRNASTLLLQSESPSAYGQTFQHFDQTACREPHAFHGLPLYFASKTVSLSCKSLALHTSSNISFGLNIQYTLSAKTAFTEKCQSDCGVLTRVKFHGVHQHQVSLSQQKHQTFMLYSVADALCPLWHYKTFANDRNHSVKFQSDFWASRTAGRKQVSLPVWLLNTILLVL